MSTVILLFMLRIYRTFWSNACGSVGIWRLYNHTSLLTNQQKCTNYYIDAELRMTPIVLLPFARHFGQQLFLHLCVSSRA